MNFFDFKRYYLVGIKGVAMASLAQMLADAGKEVRGSDVAENFVTEKVLNDLHIQIDEQFDPSYLEQTECVVYTAAHQGKFNAQVTGAVAKNIPVFSHAEALGYFFNQQKGVAVCGVGGKSTVSAMITWILDKTGVSLSFSVGVGGIVGMERTGKWNPSSQYFIAEADEYVTDPAAVAQGEKAIPRFSYLNPFITVCTHIKYDHPDVYASEQDTINAYQQFFLQISNEGVLILNELDVPKNLRTSAGVTYTFGTSETASLRYKYLPETSVAGVTMGSFWYQNQEHVVQLAVPGEYNLENAAAATLACLAMGIPIETSIAALATFASTIRRFEYKGEINGVKFYDDYGHHPSELSAVITAAYGWYSPNNLVIAFQPHTYSRTKHLFNDFVTALARTKRLVLLDIFASAREAFDPTVSSQQLAAAVSQQNPECNVTHLATIKDLELYCKTQLHQGDVLLTMGAGDIYHVHELLKKSA